VWISSGPNMDYVGSGNSGLGSVWIYSGPIWIMLGQIILVWDQYGFILDQSNPKPEFLVTDDGKP
jgi:hypothetical protein